MLVQLYSTAVCAQQLPRLQYAPDLAVDKPPDARRRAKRRIEDQEITGTISSSFKTYDSERMTWLLQVYRRERCTSHFRVIVGAATLEIAFDELEELLVSLEPIWRVAARVNVAVDR